MSFNGKIEKGGGVIVLQEKIPLSLYSSWCGALVKSGREGLRMSGTRGEQGRDRGAKEERAAGKG